LLFLDGEQPLCSPDDDGAEESSALVLRLVGELPVLLQLNFDTLMSVKDLLGEKCSYDKFSMLSTNLVEQSDEVLVKMKWSACII